MSFPLERRRSTRRLRAALLAAVCAAPPGFLGCGTTQNRSATEQLLTSDAVDRSIARIDFRPLRGQKVFLDVEYVKNAKGVGSVNAEYVISSLRQQLLAAGCLLQENKHLADFIVEPRVGALGLDGHDVIYGIPANNGLNLASTVVPTMPTLPTVPELALAKKNDQRAAAKVAVFAYHRVTREVVWQSGVSQSLSTARDSWLMGAGPFQTGTIYKEPKFVAGVGLIPTGTETADLPSDVQYSEPRVFRKPHEIEAPAPSVASGVASVGASSSPTSTAPAGVTANATSASSPVVKTTAKPVASSKEPPAHAEIPETALEAMSPEAAAMLALPGQAIPSRGPTPEPSPRRGSRRLKWDEIEREFGQPSTVTPAGATREAAPFPEAGLTPTAPPRLEPPPR